MTAVILLFNRQPASIWQLCRLRNYQLYHTNSEWKIPLQLHSFSFIAHTRRNFLQWGKENFYYGTFTGNLAFETRLSGMALSVIPSVAGTGKWRLPSFSGTRSISRCREPIPYKSSLHRTEYPDSNWSVLETGKPFRSPEHLSDSSWSETDSEWIYRYSLSLSGQTEPAEKDSRIWSLKFSGCIRKDNGKRLKMEISSLHPLSPSYYIYSYCMSIFTDILIWFLPFPPTALHIFSRFFMQKRKKHPFPVCQKPQCFVFSHFSKAGRL